MKRLNYLMILIVILLVSSCKQGTYEDSITDEDKATTVELQQLPKDTAIISIEDNIVYFFKDDLVIATAQFKGNDSVTHMTKGKIVTIMAISFIIGLALGLLFNTD